MKLHDMTITALFDAYLETVEETEPGRVATRRSHLRSIAKHLDCTENISCFVAALDNRISVYKNAVSKRTSYSPAISTLRMALRWAYGEGLLVVSPDLAVGLGMPPVAIFSNWREYKKAPSVFKILLAEMLVAQLTPDELDESFFEKFLRGLPEQIVSWRAGWREFRLCWMTATEEGLVPEVDLPEAPSKKRKNYRVNEDDLPSHLAEELKIIRERLRGENLMERRGVQPYDESTVELLIGSLLRLAGFAVKNLGINLLQEDSFASVLAIRNGLALMHRTNDEWLDEHEIPEDQRKHIGIGEYEIGLLRQFAALAHVGIQDEELHQYYLDEIKYRSQQVRIRREKEKNHGKLDDYFRVSVELTKTALGKETSGLGKIRRATLIRDALAFALFATFGYRISILTNLKLKEHVRRSEDGNIVICIRKETTKPGRRDLVHEVPTELIPLFNYYLNNARKILLKGKRDHDVLFVSSHDGSPIGSAAIYAMFVTRTAEILGEVHNPHQVRKAWASDFARWTKGDYMTASSILDNSPLTLQRHYAKIVREEQIADFDDAICYGWTMSERGAA